MMLHFENPSYLGIMLHRFLVHSIALTVWLVMGVEVWAAESVTVQDAPKNVAPGEALARRYCGACHLFPTPNLLDRETWMRHSLRKMAPLLGVGRMNLDNRPDGNILRESGIFPDHPLVTEAEWRAVMEYYRDSAPVDPLPQSPKAAPEPVTPLFRPMTIEYRVIQPLTTLVRVDSSRRKIWVGNAKDKTLDQLSNRGVLESRIPVASAPVSVNLEGTALDVALIGNVFPSDERNGSVIRMTLQADGTYGSRSLLSHLQRPTDIRRADLNGDGRNDLIVTSFGNYLGRTCWYEAKADGSYEEHLLNSRPGGLGTLVRDFNHDGMPDVLSIMGQAREGVFLYENQGAGEFEELPLLNFHPIYGTTHMELVDFNGDGFEDLLITNGDNGEYPSPFKFYHGLRIYLNDGKGSFHEAWFYPMDGAFKSMAADFDLDGDLDVVAISFFSDYRKSPDESVVYLENQGGMQFKASTIPESVNGRWLTMDVGDWDGDGDADVVLGSFTQGPPATPIPEARRKAWATEGTAVLMLENRKK